MNGVGREFSFVWAMKPKYDVLTGNPCCDEFFRDSIFRPVELDPNFSISKIYVDNRAMYPAASFPAHVEHFVMSTHIVKNCLDFNLAVGRFPLSVFTENAFNNVSVGLVFPLQNHLLNLIEDEELEPLRLDHQLP